MIHKPHLLLSLCMATLALAACATKPKPASPIESAPPAAAEDEMQAPTGAARELQEDLAATAGDRVYFDLDRFDLTGEGRETLSAQARWLTDHPDVRVLIAGNCDERGTREYNLALGARRAAAARDYLVRNGVSSARVSTVSYGKERPIDPHSGEEAWARNRNASTVVIDAAPR